MSECGLTRILQLSSAWEWCADNFLPLLISENPDKVFHLQCASLELIFCGPECQPHRDRAARHNYCLGLL